LGDRIESDACSSKGGTAVGLIGEASVEYKKSGFSRKSSWANGLSKKPDFSLLGGKNGY